MFCQECGKQNDSGSKFCANCGAALVSGPQSQPIQSSPQTVPQQQPEAQPSFLQGPVIRPKRHSMVTFAMVVWILTTLYVAYAMIADLLIGPLLGAVVGFILFFLGLGTILNLQQSKKNAMYYGFAAIGLSFIWNVLIGNLVWIIIVIIIGVITYIAKDHLVEGGI